VQSKNIISSLIIGLIDGIRSPLILAATMTFIPVAPELFKWIFTVYLFVSAVIMGLGHWLTLKSENRTASGEAFQKEKEIYQNIGLDLQDDSTTQRVPAFTQDAITPCIRVGSFYLTGGLLVFLPFLLFTPIEKALFISLIISFPLLAICAFAKARFYKVPIVMEVVRTTLLPFIAIGLIYGIIQLLA
jgi:type III secretory pathway component EscR